MFDCVTLMLDTKATTRDVPWVLTVKAGCRVQNLKLHARSDNPLAALTEAQQHVGPVDFHVLRDGVWRAES